ncbi:hypothetical protein LXA43DRAFT_905138 [Ganoderma leucocontextum]|nr:hypothetical protein LXA43DRAFT_907031 [Ganoderma leucocontextum]KAI1782662.1 hypothetical protein LXA43DRAFT_905138 [Ganoderma leucocontextum]
MPSPLVILSEADNILLCSLHTFSTTYLSQALCFGVSDRNTSEWCRIVCVRRTSITRTLLPKTPVVFDIIGQISGGSECFLSVDGVPRDTSSTNAASAEPVASCWMEPRPNVVARVNWNGVQASVEQILAEIPGEVDTSRFIRSEDGMMKIQLVWQGYPGETGASLPMFDELGNHYVPATRSDIPFDRPMHAASGKSLWH